MKTIIVPTDFSDEAGYALDLALDLAVKYDYQVVLVHVIDLPPVVHTLYFDNYGMDDLYAEARKNAENKLQQIRADYHHEKLVTAVFQGKLTHILEEIEKDYSAEFIFMGTTGASGLKEVLIGSNTEKVVRNIKTPVMAIPEPIKSTGIKHILIPTNGEDVHQGFFEKIKKLQEMLHATVDILFVNTLHAFENEDKIKRSLEEYSKKARLDECRVKVFRSFDSEEGIAEYIGQNDIDLVAIVTHGRQGITHLMQGSLAEDLVNHLKVPVFTYNLKLNN